MTEPLRRSSSRPLGSGACHMPCGSALAVAAEDYLLVDVVADDDGDQRQYAGRALGLNVLVVSQPALTATMLTLAQPELADEFVDRCKLTRSVG
jgi:hypothetical protein